VFEWREDGLLRREDRARRKKSRKNALRHGTYQSGRRSLLLLPAAAKDWRCGHGARQVRIRGPPQAGSQGKHGLPSRSSCALIHFGSRRDPVKEGKERGKDKWKYALSLGKRSSQKGEQPACAQKSSMGRALGAQNFSRVEPSAGSAAMA
jgi:hypothetical protein